MMIASTSFESSSDHTSTHISYAMVFAEENSREAIVAAMKKRHTYASTTNILAAFKAADRRARPWAIPSQAR